MTAKEILTEPVGYYAINPRSLVVIEQRGTAIISPRYNGPNGAQDGYMCMCTPDSILVEDKPCNEQPEAFLLPQYEGHPDDFYMDLQAFHDDCEYWRATEAGNELTELGLARYKHLCEIYSEE